MNTQPTLITNLTRRVLSITLTWRTLLRIAALSDVIVMVIMGVMLRDRLPLGLAVVIALGLGLLNFRSGLLGDILLALIFADTTVWTLSAALVNIVHGEEFMRLVFPAALGAISIVGVIAAVAILVWRKHPKAGSEAAYYVGLIAIAFFVLAVSTGFISGQGQQPKEQVNALSANALKLQIENMAFTTTELVANHGQVTLDIDNHDLWWHTFTIEELNVDVKLPSNGRQEITFAAKPGKYTFYCAIPGHKMAGMQGTLIVR
jgi:plastocyanin